MGVGTVCVGFLAACETGNSKDPLSDLLNKDLNARARSKAVEPARVAASENPKLADATDRALAKIAWDPLEDDRLRRAALESLFKAGGDVAANARMDALVKMPRERSREVITAVCQEAADHGWTDLIPAIVRAYSRPVKGVEDKDRAELQALRRLAPGGDVERAAFDVFAEKNPATAQVDAEAARYQRHDALNLLARLDPAAKRWRPWLDSIDASADPGLAAVVASRNDLRSVPMTGQQYEWLLSLYNPDHKENQAWWREAASAVAQLPGNEPLYLRHIEPIRWAAVNRASWLSMSRDALLEELRSRLEGRTHYLRSVDQDSVRTKDRLEQRHAELSHADLIAILVIDEQLRQAAVAGAVFRHADLDSRDKTTEYGGLLEFSPAGPPRAALYLPRGIERQGDTKFVASIDMIQASDRSLAHYHLHVPAWKAQEYSGPSDADLEYSTRYGRSCLVFTAVNENTLAVDYYQPLGVVVDLGTISRVAE